MSSRYLIKSTKKSFFAFINSYLGKLKIDYNVDGNSKPQVVIFSNSIFLCSCYKIVYGY